MEDESNNGRLRFTFAKWRGVMSSSFSLWRRAIIVNTEFDKMDVGTYIYVVKNREEMYQSFQEKSLKTVKRLMPKNLHQEVDELVQSIVQSWINRCCCEHVECQQLKREESFQLPARLIDVDVADMDAVKLIDTRTQAEKSNNRLEYLILSYCWGKGNDVAKTTLSNLKQRQHSITVASLPRTIRDAITLTRAMKVRYLWVDALCIIQPKGKADDQKDWRHESARMGLYYSNALCCISASSATDSMDGFLTERRLMQFPWLPHSVSCQRGKFLRPLRSTFRSKGNYSIKPPKLQLGDKLRKTPLMKRGWYLQEWLLSTRILHWTRVSLFWECRRDIHHESLGEHKVRIHGTARHESLSCRAVDYTYEKVFVP
ncbi:hypothetical protein AAE478_010275 [Parahypoxylon ruwenzoriense]